jgi:hypothetical protein
VDWLDEVHDKNQSQALVSMVLNLQVSHKVENSMTS